MDVIKSGAPGWPNGEARVAELHRLATLCSHSSLESNAGAIKFELAMMASDFWIDQLHVDSLSSVALMLKQCGVEWRSKSDEPVTYTDKYLARSSLPVLGILVDGTVCLARIHYCEDTGCRSCPAWSHADINGRLPAEGSQSLAGWLGIEDVWSIKNHPYVLMNQPSNVVSLSGYRFTRNDVNIFVQLQHKLEHGSEEEKQTLLAMIEVVSNEQSSRFR